MYKMKKNLLEFSLERPRQNIFSGEQFEYPRQQPREEEHFLNR